MGKDLRFAIEKIDEGLAKAEQESVSLFCFCQGSDGGLVSEEIVAAVREWQTVKDELERLQIVEAEYKAYVENEKKRKELWMRGT